MGGDKMARRIFLTLIFALMLALTAFASERRGVVTMSFDINSTGDADAVELWVPYPVSNEHQKVEDIHISGSHAYSGVYSDPETGAMMLYVRWDKGSADKKLEFRFTATGREISFKDLKDPGEPIPAEIRKFTESTRLVPTDGKIGKLAAKIVKGKSGTLQRARAVYDWVVTNVRRDPTVKGCGLGIVERTLTSRGGKCADISTVFVALARASGVPARDVFGLRLGKKDKQDITDGYNCWAEFYLPGTGWVPVNPADVRKIMLKKDLTLKKAKKYVEYYFSSADKYRIALVPDGRDMVLSPPQKDGRLNYFMYPYAEVNGKQLDYMAPKTFKYSIDFKAL